MNLRRLTAAFTAAAITAGAVIAYTPSNIAYADEGSWSQDGDKYSYTAVTKDDATEDDNISVSVSAPEDWSKVKYLAVDVTVDGTASPVLGATLAESGWTNSGWISVSDTDTTLYLKTGGEEVLYSPSLMLWGIEAGTTVTASNARYLTENPAGVWLEETEGVFTYTHGNNSAAAVPALYLSDCLTDTDWSKMNNVSLKIKVEGKAYPALCGNVGGEWTTYFKEVEDDEKIFYLVTDGAELKDAQIQFWSYGTNAYATPSAKITVSAVEASEEEFDYTQISGEWIEYEPNCFYFKLPATDYYWIGSFNNPECDISEVQSFSFDVTSSNSTALQILADIAETAANPDVKYETAVSASSTKRYTKRSVYGTLTGTPGVGVWATAGTEIRIENFTYHTEPAVPGVIESNGLLLNSDATDVFEMYEDTNGDMVLDGSVVITKSEMQKINVPGVIQIYAKPIDTSKESFCQFAINYSDGRTNFEDGDKNYTGAGWMPLPMGAPVYNIPITSDGIIEVEITEELVKDLDKLVMEGSNFRYEKAVFVPTPDSSAPEASEEITDTEKDKFGSCDFREENKAPKSCDEFEYGKPQGHRSEIKQNDKGERYYAQRIIQKVKKSDIDGAKNVTIIVYAKKQNKYMKLTLSEYHASVNINGREVKAGDDDVFLTVIFDNIPEDEELTFTEFEINK